MKQFRRIPPSRISRGVKTTARFFRSTVSASEASVSAPLGPALGQLQIPLSEFCNSFNEETTIYNESTDLRIRLKKIESKYDYLILFPSLGFFFKQIYLEYGFDLELFIYNYYIVELSDLWSLVTIFSSVIFVSHNVMSKILFGFLRSSIIRQILR
jgi:hypothetical protein